MFCSRNASTHQPTISPRITKTLLKYHSGPIQLSPLNRYMADVDAHDPNEPDHTELMCSETFVERLLTHEGSVTLANMNWSVMPTSILRMLGQHVTFLDLTRNEFRSFGFLVHFPQLHSLILDWNCDMQWERFPAIPSLKYLSMNNCSIENIMEWVSMLSVHCPDLEHLSMVSNPGEQTVSSGKSLLDEYRYRAEIVLAMRRLTTLDGRSVREDRKRIANGVLKSGWRFSLNFLKKLRL